METETTVSRTKNQTIPTAMMWKRVQQFKKKYRTIHNKGKSLRKKEIKSKQTELQ